MIEKFSGESIADLRPETTPSSQVPQPIATPKLAWDVETRSLIYGKNRIGSLSNLQLEQICQVLKLEKESYRKKPKSKIASLFKVVVEAHGGDLDEILPEVRKSLACFHLPIEGGKRDNRLVKEREVRPEEIENLTYLEELVGIIGLSAFFPLRHPPWLLLVGPPSSGKDTHCELINDPRIAVLVSRATENALLPGTADGGEAHSLLREVDGKVLVIPDMATVLGEKESTVNKFIGIHTGAFGKGEVTLSSPGTGLVRIQTRYTCLWGITPALFRRYLPVFSRLGNRFLIYRMPYSRKTYWEDEYNEMDDKKEVVVNRVLQQAKKKLPRVPSEVKKKLDDLAVAVVLARSVYWAKNWFDVENHNRLANQLNNIVRLRALFRGRNVMLEDVDFVRDLATCSIPFKEELEDVWDSRQKKDGWDEVRERLWSNLVSLLPDPRPVLGVLFE